MTKPTREDVFYLIRRIQRDCDEVLKLTSLLVPEKEWYSTTEFASIKGLEPKTVSNYASQGKYRRIRKKGTGIYEIHKSELEESYQP